MLTDEVKGSIITEHKRSDSDTGSAEVQIALMTARVRQITEHLKANSHDHHSRRGLLKVVGRRRRANPFGFEPVVDVPIDPLSQFGGGRRAGL